MTRATRDGVPVGVVTGEGLRAATLTAFEAAVLVRCTGAGGGGRARTSGVVRAQATTLVIGEFSSSEPADRLVALCPGSARRTYTAGDRHRYAIHQVVGLPGAVERLGDGWHRGYAELCAPPSTARPASRFRHARDLARVAWRAATLVAGPTRAGAPGLRMPDLDTATLLIRAARLLDLPAGIATRPGGQILVTLPVGSARRHLDSIASLTAM